MERSPFFSVYILLRGTLAEEMVNAAIQKSAEGYLLNIKGLEQDIEELKDRIVHFTQTVFGLYIAVLLPLE